MQTAGCGWQQTRWGFPLGIGFVAKTKITSGRSWLQKDYYISVCSNCFLKLIKVIIHWGILGMLTNFLV